jgi:DNA ligase-1
MPKTGTRLLRMLADTFARLEASGGRLEAIDIVAGMFARVALAELEPIVYLLQGQLRPAYEGVEFGVGERLLVRVLAQAYDASESAVATRLKRLGDLGLVAESLTSAAPRRQLTIRQAYDALLHVARTAGPGAVDRKIRLLTALLGRASALEARYLVRIVQGRLRLGIGDATVIEAAAAGALGDRRKKSLIEHAYNVRSDLGGVVRLAYARGERALARTGPRVGVPVRPALAQRLPSAEAIIARLGTVDAEPKYDGFRLQLHRDGNRVWAFSRRLESVTDMFPELTAAVRRQLRARRAIIEGEAVVHDPTTGRFLPFQVTMTRKRKYRIAEAAARHPLRLFAFDVLYANGRDWIPRPQRERHRRLAALVRSTPSDPVAVTEVFTTGRVTELQAYFDAMIRRGLEGVVAKRPDAPYRAGARGYQWVKLKRAYQSKLRDTVDVVLVGYLAGRGKRAALGIGSMLAAVYDPGTDRFRTVAKIGSGPSEREWKRLRTLLDEQATPTRPRQVDSIISPDVWVEPKLVVEVLADEITRSPLHTCGKSGEQPGYALRFPRMLDGVRTDKAPQDATSEQEIIALYRMQRSP